MPKYTLDYIVSTQEEELKRIRNRYFPLIKQGLITGYNLYSNQHHISEDELSINYLHSNLRPTDAHFIELCNKLKNEGGIILEERMHVNNKLVNRAEKSNRYATYVNKPEWEDHSNMRYFDFNGNEIPPDKAKDLERVLIGESIQYDLLLCVKNEEELRKLINLLKKYTSKFRLDKKGRIVIKNGIFVPNEESISGAWEIPFVVCTAPKDKKPKNFIDLLAISQFDIQERLGAYDVSLNTIVRANTEELERRLHEKGIIFRRSKRYLLRVAVEQYIERGSK